MRRLDLMLQREVRVPTESNSGGNDRESGLPSAGGYASGDGGTRAVVVMAPNESDALLSWFFFSPTLTFGLPSSSCDTSICEFIAMSASSFALMTKLPVRNPDTEQLVVKPEHAKQQDLMRLCWSASPPYPPYNPHL
jgi:hypothetical protein